MTEQNSNRLLVIDDEEGICEFVAEVATDLEFDARLTTRVEDFRAEFKDFDPTIIVMDLQMPDIDGIELLRELAAQDCEAQIVLISGMDSRVLSTAEHLGKSLGLRMLGVLCKPIMLEDLEATLEKAVSHGRSISSSDLTLALELGQFNIRVNSCHMGWMWGPSVEGYFGWQSQTTGKSQDELIAEVTRNIPLGVIPDDGECAKAAVFLGSDYASVVTGAALDVNGGEYMPV